MRVLILCWGMVTFFSDFLNFSKFECWPRFYFGTERERLGTFRGFGTQRARLDTFRGFGTERARLGTFKGFGTERARLGSFKKISKN